LSTSNKHDGGASDTSLDYNRINKTKVAGALTK